EEVRLVAVALAAGEYLTSNSLRLLVGVLLLDRVWLSVTGERKLAFVAHVVVLVDDAADCVRIVLVLDAVKHNQSYCFLALLGLTARFKVDGAGQAFHFFLVA